MESLAVLVVVIMALVVLSPVLALGALCLDRFWLAGLLACLSVCAGVHWLVHVTTLARWLGLLAALVGLYVLLNAAPALN